MAQVIPGLVGTFGEWQSVMAKKVDRGMDQNATIADVVDKKVSSLRAKADIVFIRLHG